MSKNRDEYFCNKLSAYSTIGRAKTLELFYKVHQLRLEIEADNNTYDINTKTIIGINNKIVCGNLKLVVYIARKFNFRLPDLCAAGNYGLIKAVNGYNPTLGIAFSTYAYRTIYTEILNTINTDGQLLPRGLIARQRLIASGILHYKVQGIRLDDTNRVPLLLEYARQRQPKSGWSTKQVTNVIKSPTCGLSDPNELLFVSRESEAVADNMSVLKLLECLNEREALIIKNRYGIECDSPLTLQSVGNLLGLTKERVRQIELRALKKMRVFRDTRNDI